MAYAEKTTVAFEQSVGEIIGLVRKAGADDIVQMESRGSFTLQFALSDRTVRFVVAFPGADAVAGMTGPRSDTAKVAEQWRRQRGRALLLVIKAKLESVASEVETFEQAFLANVVLPGGGTVYERVAEPIAVAYRTSSAVLPLLPGPGE